MSQQVNLSRLHSRKELLAALDTLRREVDAKGEMQAFDAFSDLTQERKRPKADSRILLFS